MHSSVMTNKKYIPFADENTVEVICMNRLQEAIDKKERQAQTYEGKRGDETVPLMIEWPNLTPQEMVDFDTSPASQYNDTGKLPYTSIVDPHTLEKKANWLGAVSASNIMEGVLELRKKLNAEHGAGITRRDNRALAEAEGEAAKKAEAGDFAGALALVAPLAKKAEKWPEQKKTQLAGIRDQVVTKANEAFEAVAALVDSDPEEAKKQLGKLTPRLKGTGLEEKARELQKVLKG